MASTGTASVMPPGILSGMASNITSGKVRENRLRRMAERQGLALHKSRRRDPLALDYGTYQLVDPYRNALVAGDTNHGYGLDLDDVEEHLTGGES
jgi:hypothetical protein